MSKSLYQALKLNGNKSVTYNILNHTKAQLGVLSSSAIRGVRKKIGPQMFIVCSLILHSCKKLFSRLEPVTFWSHDSNFTNYAKASFMSYITNSLINFTRDLVNINVEDCTISNTHSRELFCKQVGPCISVVMILILWVLNFRITILRSTNWVLNLIFTYLMNFLNINIFFELNILGSAEPAFKLLITPSLGPLTSRNF